ncbi:MAG TPA: polysaccharide biosynthesis/export family protein [Terriglobales bacterium]|jgi:polysaccharide export outer membrane protein|nr:polysaccharide biosynthesis/export family protein [Terriglobales bacterium]
MTLKRNPLPAILILALALMIAVSVQAQSGTAPQPATAPAGKVAAESHPPDKAHSDDAYTIGANDVLAINVWKEPDITRSVPVRSDGKISLPLAGELQASGQTPRQLEDEITKRLKNYISDPEVTVIVTESKSQKINILGMVARPGTYLLSGSTTVLDAIAMAGGFKDFAKQKSIYVLRTNPDGTQKRFPFNYKEVIQGKSLEQNIRLQSGDTVVIP